MIDSAFGKLTFDMGWKASTDILLFGKKFQISIKLKAYHEKDGITSEQKTAISDFVNNKASRLAAIERMLKEFDNGNGVERYRAKRLLFKRDGSYALLCDDEEDADGGIAVCLAPTELLLSQDEYL